MVVLAGRLTHVRRSGVGGTTFGNADYPAFAMAAAAEAIGVTPAFLRAAEAAGLFEAHRSEGGQDG